MIELAIVTAPVVGAALLLKDRMNNAVIREIKLIRWRDRAVRDMITSKLILGEIPRHEGHGREYHPKVRPIHIL